MKEKLSSLAGIKKLKQKVEEKKENLRFSLHVFKFLSGVEYLPPIKQEEFEKMLEQPDGIGLPLKYSLSKKQKNQWNKKMASDYLESIQDPLQQPPSPPKKPKDISAEANNINPPSESIVLSNSGRSLSSGESPVFYIKKDNQH